MAIPISNCTWPSGERTIASSKFLCDGSRREIYYWGSQSRRLQPTGTRYARDAERSHACTVSTVLLWLVNIRVRAAHTHCQRGTVVWENDFSRVCSSCISFHGKRPSLDARDASHPRLVDETNHAAAVARAATEAQAISGRPSCTGMMPSSGLPLFDLFCRRRTVSWRFVAGLGAQSTARLF